MSLTRNEAKAVLEQLSSLTIGEVIENTDLINAVICLKMIANEEDKPAAVAEPGLVNVKIEGDSNDKITAIKAVRMLTNLGLREAKDLVDAQWPVAWKQYTISVGAMSAQEFKQGSAAVLSDGYVSSRVVLSSTPL